MPYIFLININLCGLHEHNARLLDVVEDPQIMSELEREKILVFTPSRKIGGKRIVCYDDRYIVKLAAETDGVIVSNDTYRDLIAESPDFRKAIEERLLMYSFVNDRLRHFFFYCENDALNIRRALQLQSYNKKWTFSQVENY